MREPRLWAVKTPINTIDHGIICWTRRDVKEAYMKATGLIWPELHNKGYRPIKIRITEVA